MKKPWSLYLVALWCLLAMSVVLNGILELLKLQLPDGHNGDSRLNTLRGLVSILVFWHIWRLVQVRTFNRWFSVAFFGLWTLLLTWNCIALFPQLEQPRGSLSFIIFAVLNVACIGFLTRRSFREFAVQFDAKRENERHLSLAQKTAQRALDDELSKPKSWGQRFRQSLSLDRSSFPSRQHFPDDMPMHVGQAEVSVAASLRVGTLESKLPVRHSPGNLPP